MAITTTDTVLVLGGTGKTGRRVAQRLGSAACRSASARAPPSAVRLGGPLDLGAALDGMSAAYISYYPDIAIPGAVETVGAFARLAVERGVRRLVLLAGRGEAEAEEAERAVQASGADLTILRATWFAQNFSEDYMLDAVLAGRVALPAADTPEPFVDADDIADVAVAALTEDGHVGELYELTGPRALTFADAVAEISAAAGREVAYVPVSIDEFAAEATAQGVPGDVVALLRYLFGEVLDGRNSHTTDGVQRALGRAPKDFSDFARDAAATGVWNGVISS
jgi:uncharacterized protein YbjT (DUF2867 family)